ncbi:hypothetical protein [Nostoc sp.]|uniref:hypothetical protein n=1 Tax=Nostoc sp. TaxID=1180 RepID=UPI002FF8A8C4
MDISQKSNKFFDFNSFELMKNYQETYFNSCNNIYNSQEHKDFREKVEQPFNDFCNLIHQQIPNKIACNKFHGVIKVKKEPFSYYNTPRLYRYLDIFSTLYIEMT